MTDTRYYIEFLSNAGASVLRLFFHTESARDEMEARVEAVIDAGKHRIFIKDDFGHRVRFDPHHYAMLATDTLRQTQTQVSVQQAYQTAAGALGLANAPPANTAARPN